MAKYGHIEQHCRSYMMSAGVSWDLQPNKQSAHPFCADHQQKWHPSGLSIAITLPHLSLTTAYAAVVIPQHNTQAKMLLGLRIAIMTFVIGGICSVGNKWQRENISLAQIRLHQICTTTTTHHPCENPYPSVLTHLSSYANYVFCMRTGEYNILLHHHDSTLVDHWSW